MIAMGFVVSLAISTEAILVDDLDGLGAVEISCKISSVFVSFCHDAL
jgi:hypothetical protein